MKSGVNLGELKERLKKYKKEDINFTPHAELQAFTRDVDLEEVKENVVNPGKLVYARKQEAKYPGEEKYDCYFAYSKKFAHRYVLVLNRKIIIATIIKIERDWQKTISR